MTDHRDDSGDTTPVEGKKDLTALANEIADERISRGRSEVDGANLAPHQAAAQASATSSDVGAPLEGEVNGEDDPGQPTTMRRPDGKIMGRPMGYRPGG